MICSVTIFASHNKKFVPNLAIASFNERLDTSLFLSTSVERSHVHTICSVIIFALHDERFISGGSPASHHVEALTLPRFIGHEPTNSRPHNSLRIASPDERLHAFLLHLTGVKRSHVLWHLSSRYCPLQGGAGLQRFICSTQFGCLDTSLLCMT
jgi:hypothetical protein